MTTIGNSPWRNWYHCIGNTKGTWLPGDPRGFRTRHHDEHVDGDYRHPPPPGSYERRHLNEKRKLRHPPVYLDAFHQRRLACAALAEKLVEQQVELIELSVSRCHYHLLARFTPCIDDERSGMSIPERSRVIHRSPARPDTAYDIDPAPREMLGVAKKHCSHTARSLGRTDKGGLWAIRGKVTPIRDRAHQINTVTYIRTHEREGAAIWSKIRDLPMPTKW